MATAGDNIGYLIGRTGGRAFVHRWGRYVLLTPERLRAAEHLFTRHGGKVAAAPASSKSCVRPMASSSAPPACPGADSWPSTPLAPRCGSEYGRAAYLTGARMTAIHGQVTRYQLYLFVGAGVLAAAFVIRHLLRRGRSQ